MTTSMSKALETLNQLAEGLRADYADDPDLSVWVEDGVVWVHSPGEPQDIGVYSMVARGPGVAWCIRDGQSLVHRPHAGRRS